MTVENPQESGLIRGTTSVSELIAHLELIKDDLVKAKASKEEIFQVDELINNLTRDGSVVGSDAIIKKLLDDEDKKALNARLSKRKTVLSKSKNKGRNKTTH